MSKPNVTELTGNNFSALYTNLDAFSGTQTNIGIIVTSVPITTTDVVLFLTFADRKVMNAPKRTDAIMTDIKWILQASSNVMG